MTARITPPPPQTTGGATPEEWYHWDMELELGAQLLPVVPANCLAPVKPGSALEGKKGKVPSAITNGQAHGLREWQKRELLPAELALWRKDGRLNFCVRTGPISGVYAIDVDVEDEAQARQIKAMLAEALACSDGQLYVRTRPNSHKFAVLFRLAGEP